MAPTCRTVHVPRFGKCGQFAFPADDVSFEGPMLICVVASPRERFNFDAGSIFHVGQRVGSRVVLRVAVFRLANGLRILIPSRHFLCLQRLVGCHPALVGNT